MYKQLVLYMGMVVLITVLSGCFEDIKEPTCSDLKKNDSETLAQQEEKYPELMRNLRAKCPNQNQSSTAGYQPSTATKGLIGFSKESIGPGELPKQTNFGDAGTQ